MRLSRLKNIRVGVSLLYLIVATLLFLDLRNWFAPVASGAVLYPQFVPSAWAFVHGAAWGSTGFLAILLLTILAGRVYCSTICPLGTIQDLIRRVFRKRKPYPPHYRYPHNVLRYSVLALTGFFLLAGSNLLLNLLDPFSTFGRIVTNIVRPVGIAANNAGAVVLEHFGVYALAREHWAAIAPLATGVAAAVLLLLMYLAAVHGRLYCNTVCPVGTLLGVVSRFSFLQLRFDENSCTSCRRCVAVCKSGCIDPVSKTLDSSRCVSCYNCLNACKNDGISFGRRGGVGVKAEVSNTDPERREFLMHSGVYLLAFTGLAESGSTSEIVKKIIQSKPTTVPVVRTSPVSPPGSVSVEHFTARCTACHLCVSACPTQILLPSLFEYGVSGMMQPRMYFQAGHCNYECKICSDVCPAGAILPLTVDEKKITQTGKANFIKENCVVYTDNTACGACSEHCPTKAVKMVPYENKLNKPLGIPEVNNDYCIGCGGCEHACPTKPYKAIFVDGYPVHKQAKIPVSKKVDQEVDYQEDFPF